MFWFHVKEWSIGAGLVLAMFLVILLFVNLLHQVTGDALRKSITNSIIIEMNKLCLQPEFKEDNLCKSVKP